jgi:hypothetical protein
VVPPAEVAGCGPNLVRVGGGHDPDAASELFEDPPRERRTKIDALRDPRSAPRELARVKRATRPAAETIMKIRTIFRITSMFTFFAVACDPDIEAAQLEHEEAELDEAAQRPLSAADETDEAAEFTPEAVDDLTDAVNPSEACTSGSYSWVVVPTGTCGGCTITNYPGQKYNRQYYLCQSGVWTGPYNASPICEHC